MGNQYRSGTEPIRREMRYAFSGDIEVYYQCPKCMSHLIDMKCLHCTKNQLTPEEEAHMSEQMDALVKEYNSLTGKNIKRFASLSIGQARLEQVKNPAEPKPSIVKKKTVDNKRSNSTRDSWDDKDVAARRGVRNSCTVNGVAYRTISEAFATLKLPTGKFIPFRVQLKKEKHAIFEHNGTSYKFTITTYQSKGTAK